MKLRRIEASKIALDYDAHEEAEAGITAAAMYREMEMRGSLVQGEMGT